MRKLFVPAGFVLVLFASIAVRLAAQDARDISLPAVAAIPAAGDMSAATPTAAPLAQWSAIANLPAAKQYHAVAYCDGAIYVFGGINPNGSGYDLNCYKYTIATNTWSQIASLPSARALPGVAVVDGKIYLIGGYSSTSPFTIVASTLVYDPQSNSYTTKPNLLFPVFNAGVAVVGRRIFVIGGGNVNFQSSDNGIQVYDVDQERWTFSLTTAPYKNRSAGVAVIGSDIYLSGGISYTGTSGTLNASLYKGEVFNDEVTWTKLADIPGGPLARQLAGAGGGKLYITGGLNQASQVSAMTFAYDPATNTWETKELKPTPVFYAGDFVTDGNGKFYAIGGGTAQGGVAVCEVFDALASSSPSMVLNRTSIDEWAKRGTSAAKAVTIRNIGGQALTWNASGSAAWLSASPASGSVDPGRTETFSVVMDAAQLADGVHNGTLTITSNDPDHPSATIAVTLHVQAEDVDSDPTVLLEEGTGNWCPYCPDGADSVHAIVARYPHRVFAIAYHGGSAITATTEPMYTPTTTTWAQQTQLQGWPNGSVNRIRFEGNQYICMSRSEWDRRVREVLDQRRSPVTLTVRSASYTDGTISLEIETLFHRDLDVPVRLNVAQTQDHLNWQQASQTGTRYPYYHDHVLRQMIPNDFGEPLFAGSSVTSQTRVSKSFTFVSRDSTIPLSRLIVFAHVSDGNTYGEVLQALELPLSDFVTAVGNTPSVMGFSLSGNYPNPFNPATTVRFDVPTTSFVRLIVTDALGREIGTLADGEFTAGSHHVVFDAAGLPSGVYYVTMRSGGFVATRPMTLAR
ncbi:MAG: kelch repeat-containing protein [Bacteroidota bacterium]|nr:kelch repeat-containing protein [Bacteroidota bacterium]